MMIVLKEYVDKINVVSQAPANARAWIDSLILEVICPEEEHQEIQVLQDQFDKLFGILSSISKMIILSDCNHRRLISIFIKLSGIEHYKYSYYNRAKISQMHIQKLLEVGPILFSEAVMIASKLNTINKNSSRIYTENSLYCLSQNPIDLKIQQILKLCDCKKRAVNNNFRKLELILDGADSLEIIKELGKMLRDSWKKDKSKVKCFDVVLNCGAKQMVKICEGEGRGSNREKCKDYEISVFEDVYSFTQSQKEIINQGNKSNKIQQNLSFFNEEGFVINPMKDYFENVLNQENV